MKFAVLFLTLAVAVPAVAFGQNSEEELGWRFETELTGVWNSGNSVNTTFGLAAQAEHYWPRSKFKLVFGGTQTEATLITRTAQGTKSDFVVTETEITDKTAELYYGRARFDHNITPKFYAFGAVDWLRNVFAGVDSRYLLAIGAGNQWIKNDRTDFKTDYAFTYTFQEEIVENPITGTKFPGVRLSYDLTHQLTSSTDWESWATADMNLEKTEDVRTAWYNALSVSISEKLFLKPAFTWLWRNEPAFTDVPLLDGGGADTGTNIPVQFKKSDTIFSLSLVAKF